MSGKPGHAYPVDYQPRYHQAMGFVAAGLLAVLICAWIFHKAWRLQDQAAAANTAEREANAQSKTGADAQRKTKRQPRSNHRRGI